MTTRALTLAIRLLTAAVVGTVLIGVEAGCCQDPWSFVVDFKLDTDADLNAVATDSAGFIIATADGQLIRASNHGEIWDPAIRQDSVEYAGTVPLNAVATSYLVDPLGGPEIWVVGDQGLLLHKLGDGPWETIDLGTSERLVDILVVDEQWMVIVGDGVMRVKSLSGDGGDGDGDGDGDPGGGDWISPPEPEEGWGELRAVFGDGERLWAVGANGVAWTSTDPTTSWVREDTDLGNVDLNGGGPVGSYGRAVLVGDGGSLAWYDGVRWWAKNTSVDVDLLDCDGGVAVGRDGRLFEVDGNRLHRVDKTEGINRGLWSYGVERNLIVVGEGGRGRWFYSLEGFCGGRPFMVDGEARIASAVLRDDWCTEPPDPIALPAPLASTLAAAWTRDALFEHASVASFARFSLDLLELGAPPELVHAAKRAALDEIDHAARCFALAQRYGAEALGPGSLAVAGRRSGGLAARICELFDEACVNETLAACEAAVAAAGCRDPKARTTLERIAEDEHRHAVLAWRCLEWMLGEWGDAVAAPLREHLRRRGRAFDRSSTPHLPEWGRLGTAARAEIHARVYCEAVLPLVDRLLTGYGPSIEA